MPAKTKRTTKPAATTSSTAGPIRLSPTAQATFDEIALEWQLTPPVRVLLRLACEAITKAEQLEAITAVEGMVVGDHKGSVKPHPASLLARDYRAQAASAMQRILSNLGS